MLHSAVSCYATGLLWECPLVMCALDWAEQIPSVGDLLSHPSLRSTRHQTEHMMAQRGTLAKFQSYLVWLLSSTQGRVYHILLWPLPDPVIKVDTQGQCSHLKLSMEKLSSPRVEVTRACSGLGEAPQNPPSRAHSSLGTISEDVLLLRISPMETHLLISRPTYAVVLVFVLGMGRQRWVGSGTCIQGVGNTTGKMTHRLW